MTGDDTSGWSRPPQTGPWYDMMCTVGPGIEEDPDRYGLSSTFESREVQAEYFVPLEHAQPALRAVWKVAKERGLEVREVKTEREGDYHTLIRVSVKTEEGERSVAGTLFNNSEPRLIEMFGIKVEAELTGHMMYIVNEDAPGFIGSIGTLLGQNKINIGTFNLGRRDAGGEAVMLLSVDGDVPENVLKQACELSGVKKVKELTFV